MNLVKLDRERPMLRSSLTLLIAAAAAGLATGNVQAGGCADPCGPGVVAVVAAPTPAPAPFYIVDQGPVYYGPGVTRGPTFFEDVTSPYRFPYIGSSYYWAPVQVRSYAGHRYVRRVRVR